MRTLIDVSLFVHTRRAWHRKQYFKPATIVVAHSVTSLLLPFFRFFTIFVPVSLSLGPLIILPFSFLRPSPGSLSAASPFLLVTGAPGPSRLRSGMKLRSVSHRRCRHARTNEPSYEPRVSLVHGVFCLPSTCTSDKLELLRLNAPRVRLINVS